MLRFFRERLCSTSYGPAVVRRSWNNLRAPQHHQQPWTVLCKTAVLSRMSSTWTGTGSQQQLMLTDECILVDEADAVVGHANKQEAHRFIPSQPHGLLHRAFSVFLFDVSGRLLLQQRANSKVTFPGVWTNTCCSHPLFGQQPDEVDTPEAVAAGTVPGAISAAVRKLRQELGIQPEQLPTSNFRFLTRLHYCAADIDRWGPNAQWGEHEVDYILLLRANVKLEPNPDEVEAVRYVTQPELTTMLDPTSGLRWSPWFRIIAERLLPAWWSDLDGALAPGSGRHADYGTIHHILDAK